MRLAIIDLGTNSIRFDIQEVSTTRTGAIQHRRLYREKTMVRLGQNLFLQGTLSPESKRRTLQAVQSFRSTMDALKIDQTLAFGTAALRDASDGESFLEEIKEITGVEFRTITGDEEASLIAKGILANQTSLPKGIFALVDIGGGSTEVSLCKGRNVIRSHSFDLGVAKLQQVFLKSQPPLKIKKLDPVVELRNFIKSVVLPKLLIERWPKASVMIGSSGSIVAIAKLVHKDKDASVKPFQRKDLSRTVELIKTKNTAQLLSIKGMEPKRVDMILAGGILLDELCALLGTKQIRTTEFSLRDGILEDALARYRLRGKQKSDFSFDDIEKRISLWGMDLDQLKQLQRSAEFLFDELRPVHQLKPEWRSYLSAASLLHGVGEIISPAHCAEHSEYMIKNANFVGMQAWESNLIAHLCRYPREEKILEKKNDKKIPYDKKDELRVVFLKLLSLFQLAIACDRAPETPLKLKKPKITRSRVEFKFTSKVPCDLEILRFEQKKVLFETLFGRALALSPSQSG